MDPLQMILETDMNRYDVGRRIETYRDKMKMSTQELASRIKRSQATISRIENGKQGVSLELLSQIAHELHVHPFALLSDGPLRHSVLLPIASGRMGRTGRGNDYATNLLAHALAVGRVGRKMESAEAAGMLGISIDELESIEFGFSLPDPETIDAMAKLYGLEARDLQAIARLGREAPEVSKRLSFLYQMFAEIHHALKLADPAAPEATVARMRELLAGADSDAALLHGTAGAEAESFLKHMSSNLESAMQDDRFRDQVMKMVKRHETEKFRVKSKGTAVVTHPDQT